MRTAEIGDSNVMVTAGRDAASGYSRRIATSVATTIVNQQTPMSAKTLAGLNRARKQHDHRGEEQVREPPNRPQRFSHPPMQARGRAGIQPRTLDNHGRIQRRQETPERDHTRPSQRDVDTLTQAGRAGPPADDNRGTGLADYHGVEEVETDHQQAQGLCGRHRQFLDAAPA
jgi:hypothetical protein